jgi:hypothetical protein
MERISASSPVKRWVLAILPMLALKKGCAWVRAAPVPASPLLTGCGRSDNPAFAGTGRGTGFSGPNKELDQGERAGGHGFTGWYCTERRDRKKEALRGSLDQRRRITGRLTRGGNQPGAAGVGVAAGRGGRSTITGLVDPVANVLLDCFGNRFVELVFRQQAEFTAQIGLSPILKFIPTSGFSGKGQTARKGCRERTPLFRYETRAGLPVEGPSGRGVCP